MRMVKGNPSRKRRTWLATVSAAFIVLVFCAGLATGQTVSVSDVALNATSPENSTDDNLICTYTLSAEATQAAVAWLIDGSPMMSLYLPMEGGETNGLADRSGNAHTVTAVGSTASAWSPGSGPNGDGAYEFDNSFYMDAGDIFPLSASYSKAAWVLRYNVPTASNNVISSEDVAGGHVLYCSQSQGFRFSAGQLGNWNLVQDPTPTDYDTWYHVAVTFDYATGFMALYTNGVLVDTATAPPTHLDITDATLQIGSFSNSSQWNGLIADARLYSHVLSADQVAALYNGDAEIASAETTDGEEWQAVVTPFSDDIVGTAVSSNTLVIGDPDAWMSDLLLEASSPGELTTDDLTVSYTLEGNSVTAATAWMVDDAPLMTLYLPIEGGYDNAIVDYSGNDYSLVASGDPVFAATGGDDGFGALELDGDDHLDAGDAFPTQSSYTKVAWVKRSGTASNNIISGDAGHVFFASSSSQDNHLAAGHNGTYNLVKDTDPLPLDTWVHAAVTFDYATGEMILYRNGLEVDRDTASVPDREMTDARLYVGAFNGSSQLIGALDDVRIYDRVLSADQIDGMYNNGHGYIAAAETQVGEVWHGEVTPFAASEAGATMATNAITIHPSELQAPTITHPLMDEIEYCMTPTFRWTESLGPFGSLTTYYRIDVATDETFLFHSSVDSIVDTQFIWPDSLDFGEDYYWRVEAWVDTGSAVVTVASDDIGFYTWTIGDVNNDHSVNIADLTTLVAYLFSGGAVEPQLVADLNGVCGVNITDLTYMVAYLFNGGGDLLPPPSECWDYGCD